MAHEDKDSNAARVDAFMNGCGDWEDYVDTPAATPSVSDTSDTSDSSWPSYDTSDPSPSHSTPSPSSGGGMWSTFSSWMGWGASDEPKASVPESRDVVEDKPPLSVSDAVRQSAPVDTASGPTAAPQKPAHATRSILPTESFSHLNGKTYIVRDGKDADGKPTKTAVEVEVGEDGMKEVASVPMQDGYLNPNAAQPLDEPKPVAQLPYHSFNNGIMTPPGQALQYAGALGDEIKKQAAGHKDELPADHNTDIIVTYRATRGALLDLVQGCAPEAVGITPADSKVVAEKEAQIEKLYKDKDHPLVRTDHSRATLQDNARLARMVEGKTEAAKPGVEARLGEESEEGAALRDKVAAEKESLDPIFFDTPGMSDALAHRQVVRDEAKQQGASEVRADRENNFRRVYMGNAVSAVANDSASVEQGVSLVAQGQDGTRDGVSKLAGSVSPLGFTDGAIPGMDNRIVPLGDAKERQAQVDRLTPGEKPDPAMNHGAHNYIPSAAEANVEQLVDLTRKRSGQ